MKFKTLFQSLFLLISSFAFANNGQGIINSAKQTQGVLLLTETKQVEKTEDDGLYCHVKCPDGTTYTCWFCRCDSLPPCSDKPKVDAG
jgi:hypothetical protein